MQVSVYSRLELQYFILMSTSFSLGHMEDGSTELKLGRLMHRGTAEVVQRSKSTSGKMRQGCACASGGLTLGFATHLVMNIF